MEPDFWRARWSEGRIGFHEGKPNAHLERHAPVFQGARRVLVPLCGKAVDLWWLAARGHEVVGVELVEDAVRACFAERGLEPAVTDDGGPLRTYSAGGVTVHAGDFFAATPALLGRFDALFDRAALIALPQAMRGRYVAHLRSLLEPGARGLLVSLEYPQDRFAGPPFSVPEAEVRQHWAGATVELLAEQAASGGGGAVVVLGDAVREKCFSLRPA